MTQPAQILDSASDQLRAGRVDDAVALLLTAIEWLREHPEDAEGIRPRLRELQVIQEAGARFWAGWASVVSPKAEAYTPHGGYAEGPLDGRAASILRG